MRKLLGWATLFSLALTLAAPLISLSLDSFTGVEGWEMASIYEEQLSLAQESPDRASFLEAYGFSESDAIFEQLSLIGRTGPFTQRGEMTRFVLVPTGQQRSSPFGTLVIFDRTAGEELLQARSLRNITIVVTLIAAAATLVLALGYWLLARRKLSASSN